MEMAKTMQQISSLLNQEYAEGAFKMSRSKVLSKESERQSSVVDMQPKKGSHASLLTEAHLGRALLLLDVNGIIKLLQPCDAKRLRRKLA